MFAVNFTAKPAKYFFGVFVIGFIKCAKRYVILLQKFNVGVYIFYVDWTEVQPYNIIRSYGTRDEPLVCVLWEGFRFKSLDSMLSWDYIPQRFTKVSQRFTKFLFNPEKLQKHKVEFSLRNSV